MVSALFPTSSQYTADSMSAGVWRPWAWSLIPATCWKRVTAPTAWSHSVTSLSQWMGILSTVPGVQWATPYISAPQKEWLQQMLVNFIKCSFSSSFKIYEQMVLYILPLLLLIQKTSMILKLVRGLKLFGTSNISSTIIKQMTIVKNTYILFWASFSLRACSFNPHTF